MNISGKYLFLLLALGLTLCSATLRTNSFVANYQVDSLTESSYHLVPNDTVRGLTFEMFEKLTTSLDTLPKAMKKAWSLWKAEKWAKLETYFEKNNLNSQYPPADGFISVATVTLVDDTKVDRYGSLWGTFVAPTGTPFGERALPSSSKSRVYYKFEVTKDIEKVLKGNAIPWFNQRGKGIQYLMPQSIKDLVADGYIVVLDSIVPQKVTDKYKD